MNYITQSDLKTAVGGEEKLLQLAAENRQQTLADEEVQQRITSAIEDAESTFDAYARTRYTIPVAPTRKVKSVCIALAIFNLVGGRASAVEGKYEVHERQYKNAMTFLRDLQKGLAALDVPTVEETETKPASPDRVLRGNTRPVFTDEHLGSY